MVSGGEEEGYRNIETEQQMRAMQPPLALHVLPMGTPRRLVRGLQHLELGLSDVEGQGLGFKSQLADESVHRS